MKEAESSLPLLPKPPLHIRLAAIVTRASTPPHAHSFDAAPVTSPTGEDLPSLPYRRTYSPLPARIRLEAPTRHAYTLESDVSL